LTTLTARGILVCATTSTEKQTMAKRKKRKSSGKCAGRTAKGHIKPGYRLKKGSCPVKVKK
jgi:hypothetical protein